MDIDVPEIRQPLRSIGNMAAAAQMGKGTPQTVV
jgi:hypothetical protein